MVENQQFPFGTKAHNRYGDKRRTVEPQVTS